MYGLDVIVKDFQLFLVLFGRIAGLFFTAPLLNSSALPGAARIGLSMSLAYLIMGEADAFNLMIPENILPFSLVLLSEVLLGVITGFMIYAFFILFQLAGQMFAVQMGFAASQVYDPLAQIQIPLLGQFLNLVAMLVFLSQEGFLGFFVKGIYNSFMVVNSGHLLGNKNFFKEAAFYVLPELFKQAMIISLPIIGTLFMISVTMGLLAKAAPQMNLLMVGFPLQIAIGFLILYFTFPFLIEKMGMIMNGSIDDIMNIMGSASLNSPGAAP